MRLSTSSPSGQVDTFYSLATFGSVQALTTDTLGQYLYVGDFKTVGGNIAYLTRIILSTGLIDANFNINIGTTTAGNTFIAALDPWSTSIYYSLNTRQILGRSWLDGSNPPVQDSGSLGLRNNQFLQISGLVVDRSGSFLYVVDAQTAQLLRFDLTQSNMPQDLGFQVNLPGQKQTQKREEKRRGEERRGEKKGTETKGKEKKGKKEKEKEKTRRTGKERTGKEI